MTLWAFYQAYYGGDLLRLSLESILPQVDKVLFFWSDRPWFDLTEVEWCRTKIPIPEDLDGIVRFARENKDPRIEPIYFHRRECVERISAIVNEHILPRDDCPDFLLYMATDYALQDNILRGEQGAQEALLRAAGLTSEVPFHFLSISPISLWRYFSYRQPQVQDRVGAILMNLTPYKARSPRAIPIAPHEKYFGPLFWEYGHTIDMGLACTPRTMLWKHLLRIAQAPLIPDDIPVEEWFEVDWLPWTPEVDRHDLGWCRGERSRSVVRMPSEALPTCLRSLALAEKIPDEYSEMDWEEILASDPITR